MFTSRSFAPRFVAAILFCIVMIAARCAQAGEWMTDQKTGCQVWNPNPQLEESVAWSGACTASRAEGTGSVRWLRADTLIESDEGEWRDGRQVGPGSQIWPTGRYDGQIADSEPNGRGVLTLQKLRYEGEFRDGKPNGTGTLTVGSDSVHGNWKDGCLQNAQRKAAIGVPLSACR
jgi:MORN repeat